MNLKIILLIAGMAAVTYIPRLVPSLFMGRVRLSPKFEKFLRLIPYTAMASLIFPGVLSAVPGAWFIGAAGALAALLLSVSKKIPSSFAVIGAVIVVLVLKLLV